MDSSAPAPRPRRRRALLAVALTPFIPAVASITALRAAGFVILNAPRARLPWTARRAHSKLTDPAVAQFIERHVVDEEAAVGAEPFPIPPDELITLAKVFLATEAPEATVPGNGSMLTDNFRFVGPVIGPLDKAEFMDTVKSIEIFRCFPDATAQFHHFRVDPFEPSRVWYTARGTGVHTGKGVPGTDTDLMFGPPTGLRYRNPPQACSLRFTEAGLVDQFTIGYVMDRYIGNTGGLGGFFGVLYAVGKQFPFEEGKPWRPSLGYQLYVTIGGVFNRLRATLAGEPAKAIIVMPKGTDEA